MQRGTSFAQSQSHSDSSRAASLAVAGFVSQAPNNDRARCPQGVFLTRYERMQSGGRFAIPVAVSVQDTCSAQLSHDGARDRSVGGGQWQCRQPRLGAALSVARAPRGAHPRAEGAPLHVCRGGRCVPCLGGSAGQLLAPAVLSRLLAGHPLRGGHRGLPSPGTGRRFPCSAAAGSHSTPAAAAPAGRRDAAAERGA
jgi:hypothetical protein